MLSRLNWDLQLGLLRSDGSLDPLSGSPPEGRLDRSIEEIALTARGTVESTLVKDWIEDALRREWRGFLRVISEAAEVESPRIFELFDANLRLISRKYEPWDLRDVHDDCCRRLTSPGVDLVGRLLKILEGEIGEGEIRALHLGKLVDHGVHPQDVFRLTFQEPLDFDSPTIDLDYPRRGSWWLATRQPEPGEVVPEREWFRSVEKRWEELDVAKPLPSAFLHYAGGKPGRVEIGDWAGLIADVNRAAAAGLTEVGRHGPTSIDVRVPDPLAQGGAKVVPGYLGLLLDRDGLVAGRAGYDAKLELATRLRWGILLKLDKYRDMFCPKKSILNCWPEAGLQELPGDGAIYQAISELRSCLKQKLGLTIKNQRDEGWRLEDNSPESAVPPA